MTNFISKAQKLYYIPDNSGENREMVNKVLLYKKEIIYHIIILTIAYVVLVCLGNNGYFMTRDSHAYLAFDGRTGIMPLYPIIIHLNRVIFGENYLNFLVIEQTLLAFICIYSFTAFIKKRFSLGYVSAVVVFALCLIPFTTNFPESMTNREIATEALAYPLFYLYMILFFKTIFEKKIKNIMFLLLASILMAMTRTQMQMIFVCTAAASFYLIWMRNRYTNFLKKLSSILLGVMMGIILILLGEFLLLQVNSVGQRIIFSLNQSVGSKADSADSVAEKNSNENVTGQFSHVIIDKAFYEIDYEDQNLFEGEMKELFLCIYQAADENQTRYVYMRDDLWRWEDIMHGIEKGTKIAGQGWQNYIEENPDTSLEFSDINTIAWKLLIHHFDRVILHMLYMMPQGFICTVFFQKEAVYTLCHIITLLIYASALYLVIWGYRKKGRYTLYAEGLLGCVVVNFIFVFVLSLVFFAMQRYLVYCFGIFYVMYFLLLKEFCHYHYDKIRKRGERTSETFINHTCI